MNYLAHLYLSGDNDDILTGNFIADSIKEKDREKYSEEIQRGILLHRKIDVFTDTHPVVLKSKIRLRPNFGKYAPVITDIFYDHFLAADWERYHPVSLHDFAVRAYAVLKERAGNFPERTRRMLGYMIRDNWLESYRSIEGVNRALTNMAKRARFRSNMEHAAEYLEKGYESYRDEFNRFFPELMAYTQAGLKNSGC